ncbi:hypothetical protein T484DRAFT_1787004 [Baffinella frigidus]|nr:hypothetical protein T484DRAFT_1787004 [Cryptophyta sp. CCMP2293]
MLKQVVLGVAMCVASADAMFHGGGQWQTLEVVPQSAVRVIQPRRGARPGPFRVTPRQQMLACALELTTPRPPAVPDPEL